MNFLIFNLKFKQVLFKLLRIENPEKVRQILLLLWLLLCICIIIHVLVFPCYFRFAVTSSYYYEKGRRKAFDPHPPKKKLEIDRAKNFLVLPHNNNHYQ